MCLAGEEVPGGSTAGVGGGGIPEIVVTAPRLGLDIDTYQMIDWAEVGKIGGIATVGGALTGGVKGAVVTGTAGAAIAIESQPGIDLDDLFVIKHDLIVVPRVPAPYISLH